MADSRPKRRRSDEQITKNMEKEKERTMRRREGLASLRFVWQHFERQQEVTSPRIRLEHI